MRIEDFIDASNRASSVDELFEMYKKAMADLGFDRLIFSLMAEHLSIHRPAGHGIMLNYPPDWMNFYIEKNFQVTDPVRHKLFVTPAVFSWHSLVESGRLTKRQVDTLEMGREAGLKDGIGIPLRGPRGAIAGIGAASTAGGVELDKNSLSHAQLLSQQFYTVYLSLESAPENLPLIVLSDREQEVLTWTALGKTRGEIGEIMCLSEHTIDTYVRRILRKLDANSIILAAFKALHMGLIQV
jgi:DNA-binding CsgD family transcriptional regulator